LKKNVNPGIAIVVIIVAILLALFLGYRVVSGGSNADVTQQNIQHWRQSQSESKLPKLDRYGPGAHP
jgi:uncharacterized protein YpmB